MNLQRCVFVKEKSKGTVSIIGGADGPTSVFVVGRTGKKTLKEDSAKNFHKFSIAVWAIWLVPYVLGMIIGMK